MDLQMPLMDGYQATEYIRAYEDAKKDTPIIAITAHTIEGEFEKCMSIGMNDFMSKPFDAEVLYEKIALLTEKY